MYGGDSTLRRDAAASPRTPCTYIYREVLQVLGIAVILRLNARTFELGGGWWYRQVTTPAED